MVFRHKKKKKKKTKHIDFSIIDHLNIKDIFIFLLMYKRKMKDSLVNISYA